MTRDQEFVRSDAGDRGPLPRIRHVPCDRGRDGTASGGRAEERRRVGMWRLSARARPEVSLSDNHRPYLRFLFSD